VCGIALLAIGEFAGQATGIHRGFAAASIHGPCGRLRGRGLRQYTADDAAGNGGVLVKPFAELLVYELLDVTFDVAVEFAFGLSFELRLRQANADDGDETFANVVTSDSDFVFLFFQHARVGSEIVYGASERGTKAGEVRAAVDGVDGVGEGETFSP